MTRESSIARAPIFGSCTPLGVFLATLSACSPAPTGLTLFITADGAVERLRVTSTSEDGSPTFPEITTTLPAGTTGGSLVILMSDERAGQQVEIRADGFSDGDAVRLTATGHAEIVREMIVEVPLALAPAALPARCGDDRLEAPEGCDDGNSRSGDGCSSGCDLETGWSCEEPPCAEICGDGLHVGQEGCDDANVLDQDGCSNTCAVEAGWACSGGSCTLVCSGASDRGCQGLDDMYAAGVSGILFGVDQVAMRRALDLPADGDPAWEEMPIAGEYGNMDIRYTIVDTTYHPVYAGQDLSLSALAVFFFVDHEFFRLSLRFDPSTPRGAQNMRAFAAEHEIELVETSAGAHFFAKTASVLVFGATSGPAGCFSQGACLEIIQAGKPTWDRQPFR